MRILIHGGTEDVIRYQSGEWNIPLATLSDRYGVPQKGWTIGCGVIEEQSFLILKRLQTGTANRTYSFSILFDPGDEVWARFGWNAPRLALSLLDEEKNEFAVELLNNPENLSKEKVLEMCARLPENKIPSKGETISFPTILIGSLFEPEPLSINPHQIKLKFDFAELAAQVEILPPIFRNGKGWLIGGHLNHAKALGVNLVLDPLNQSSDEDSIGKLRVCGANYLSVLNELMQKPEYKNSLKKYTGVPLWRWKREFGEDPMVFSERLIQLDTLCNQAQISDEQVREYEKEIQTKGVLSAELRVEFWRLVYKTEGSYTPGRTAYLLKKIDDGTLPADEIPARLFDRHTVIEWFSKKRSFPSQIKFDFEFEAREKYAFCKEIIENERKLIDIPRLLEKSIDELGGKENADYCADLSQRAFEKTAADWFSVWYNYREKPFFKDFVDESAMQKAREETEKALLNWKSHYLVFARDAGGKWLSETAGKNHILGLIQFARKEISENRLCKEDALAWFHALAATHLRSRLLLNTKFEIINTDNSLRESWKNFLFLKRILDVEGVQIKESAPKEEVEYLLTELNDFLELYSKLDLSNKQLSALKKFLGELPPALNEKFEALQTVSEPAPPPPEAEAGTAETPKTDEPAPVAFEETPKTISLAQLDFAKELYERLKYQAEQEKLIVNFWRAREFWNDAFPILPLLLRGEILALAMERNKSDFLVNLEYIYRKTLQDMAQTTFTLSLWETLLLSETGLEVRDKLQQRLGEKHELPENLLIFVIQSAEGFNWEIAKSKAPKQEDESLDTESEEAAAGEEEKEPAREKIGLSRRLTNWFRKNFTIEE